MSQSHKSQFVARVNVVPAAGRGVTVAALPLVEDQFSSSLAFVLAPSILDLPRGKLVRYRVLPVRQGMCGGPHGLDLRELLALGQGLPLPPDLRHAAPPRHLGGLLLHVVPDVLAGPVGALV